MTGVQIQALGQASAAGLRAEAPLALVSETAVERIINALPVFTHD